MKDKVKEKHWTNWCCGGANGKLLCGSLFLIFGIWLLAKSLGYVSYDLPIWPIILIIIGLWILLKRNNNC